MIEGMDSVNKKVDAIYSVTLATDTLFPEVWECKVRYNWLNSKTFPQPHLEFWHDGPGLISETGYRSHFPPYRLEVSTIVQFIESYLKNLNLSNFQIKEQS